MLQKSREITTKMQSADSSDDDDNDADTNVNNTGGDTHYSVQGDTNNPWMAKPTVTIRLKSDFSRPEKVEQVDGGNEEENQSEEDEGHKVHVTKQQGKKKNTEEDNDDDSEDVDNNDEANESESDDSETGVGDSNIQGSLSVVVNKVKEKRSVVEKGGDDINVDSDDFEDDVNDDDEDDIDEIFRKATNKKKTVEIEKSKVEDQVTSSKKKNKKANKKEESKPKLSKNKIKKLKRKAEAEKKLKEQEIKKVLKQKKSRKGKKNKTLATLDEETKVKVVNKKSVESGEEKDAIVEDVDSDEGEISEGLVRKRTLEDLEKVDDGEQLSTGKSENHKRGASGSGGTGAAKKARVEGGDKGKMEEFIDPNKLFTLATRMRQTGELPDVIGKSL